MSDPRAHLRRGLLAATAVLVLALASLLPAAAEPAPGFQVVPNAVRVPLRASGVDERTRVEATVPARAAQTATFRVTYDAGFQANPAAQAAFQAAVDIWAAQLTSGVPITVSASFTNLGPGVLGSAGFTYGVLNSSTSAYYPAPLAASLAGRDFRPTSAMIEAQFSSSASWYYGTDGRTPSGRIDLESVVLHELGHGLGFAGSGNVVGGVGSISSPALAYDRAVVDAAGTSVLNLANGTAAMAILFRGNGLYWGGASGVASNGGARPKLYAPLTWQDGSSYSHLDEATYPAGNANSLMTPRIGSAESIHDPGPIVRGMFQDMGWTIGSTTNLPVALPVERAHRVFVPIGNRNARP